MFNKFESEYNPKIDFLFLYYMNPKFVYIENFEELKTFYRKKTKPVSEQGIWFEKMFNAYNLIKLHGVTNFTLKKAIEILDDSKKNNIEIDIFIRDYTEINQLYFENSYLIILQYLLKNNYFKEYNYEMTAIIFNAELIKRNIIPIIFTRVYMEYLHEKINKKISIEGLDRIIGSFYDLSNKYLKKYDLMSKQEVIDILIKNKYDLLERFNITKIWLYGSFVKEYATEFSDVDLFVEFKFSKKIDLNFLKKQLAFLFNRSVDIQQEGFYKESYSKKVFEERELIYDLS